MLLFKTGALILLNHTHICTITHTHIYTHARTQSLSLIHTNTHTHTHTTPAPSPKEASSLKIFATTTQSPKTTRQLLLGELELFETSPPTPPGKRETKVLAQSWICLYLKKNVFIVLSNKTRCVCLCVCETERESVCVCVCVFVCV